MYFYAIYHIKLFHSPCILCGCVYLTYLLFAKNINCLLWDKCGIYICYSTCIESRWYTLHTEESYYSTFLFANKRARSLKGIVQSNVRKQAVATLFDYIILYRDIVNVTETVLSTFYSRGGCFTFHLFKAKPKRAPAISTFHLVGDGRINFS